MTDISTRLKDQYFKLLHSGMFWEFYPELTGEWPTDKTEWMEIQLADKRAPNFDNSSYFDKLPIDEQLQSIADANKDTPLPKRKRKVTIFGYVPDTTPEETDNTISRESQPHFPVSDYEPLPETAAAEEYLDTDQYSPRQKVVGTQQSAVDYVESNYPEMVKEFKRIQEEQYKTFCKKQRNYGPGNISVGTKLETDDEVKVSLTGIWFRINDKIQRLKQLVVLGQPDEVDESIQDSFDDMSVYGIIAQIVRNGKWSK